MMITDAKFAESGEEGSAGGFVFYDCDADNDVTYTDENGETQAK